MFFTHRLYYDIKRYKWNVGSKLEIFSVSQSLWQKGKVVKTMYDREGEFLTVIYHDKQKTLSRYNKHLRPCPIDLNYTQEKSMPEKNQIFYVGQKCEIKDQKYGWS